MNLSRLQERAWKALRQCLNAGGTFRIYSTPNGLRATTYYRLTSSAQFRVFRWPSWVNPNWTEQRESELLEFYKEQAMELADRLELMAFVKDMVLQLLVKGGRGQVQAVFEGRGAHERVDIDEVVCVNPESVKVKYAQGELTEVKQYQEEAQG